MAFDMFCWGLVHEVVRVVSRGQGLRKVALFVGFYKGFVVSVDSEIISEWLSTGIMWVLCTLLSEWFRLDKV